MVTNKYIAYRTKDLENDAWSEDAFLFKNNEDVSKFFVPDNPTLIEIFTDEDNREIRNFEVNNGNPAGHITSITFETDYAGEVRIVMMSEGYLIT